MSNKSIFADSDFHVTVPTLDVFPDKPYTVVYDAEYTGFKPFTQVHDSEIVGQTVSVLDESLRSDDIFAIRELRGFSVTYDDMPNWSDDPSLHGSSKVYVLSRDEFSDLLKSDFSRDYVGGVLLKTVEGLSGDASYSKKAMNGCVLGHWPSNSDGYGLAVACAAGSTGRFENFSLDTIRDGLSYYQTVYDNSEGAGNPSNSWSHNYGMMRTYTPAVLDIHDLVSGLSRSQEHDCNVRANQHELVRDRNRSTLLDRLSTKSTIRAAEVFAHDSKGLKQLVSASAKPSDLFSDFVTTSSFDDAFVSRDYDGPQV